MTNAMKKLLTTWLVLTALAGLPARAMAQTDYTVGSQDVLTITVFGEAEVVQHRDRVARVVEVLRREVDDPVGARLRRRIQHELVVHVVVHQHRGHRVDRVRLERAEPEPEPAPDDAEQGGRS